ncbi:Mur ligase [Opitutia bacterium ISCC 51]|nr:Mur ligase [Opitutae bacterium ISCC 51]QXD26489.1 Mur ligase [Opitutae bacterium ISCC 52]
MRIYFIGICGTAMGNVAVLMQRAGHTIAGSDQGIYTPMSTVLEEAGVQCFAGWDESNLETFQPDLVVVGNAVTRGNPEVEFILRRKQFSFTSLPALIDNQLLGDRSRIVITGTHGKTTTTALTAWLLKQGDQDPGWLIGGVPNSLSSGSELGNGTSPFVLEGDEYDSAFFDKRSKFIHYRPDVLVINNIEFDHADIFRDLADVKRTFNHLIRIVPGNGVILANGDDPVIRELLPVSWTQVCFVGVEDNNDFIIQDFNEGPSGSAFRLVDSKAGKSLEVSTQLNGIFNARNTAMAMLASGFAVNREHPMDFCSHHSLDGYRGVARRQDVLFESEQLFVIEDFAHHPTAIRLCIESFKNCYPEREVVAVFEPRSNTSATNVLQEEFMGALGTAHRVLISPVHRAEIYSDDSRMDTNAMVETLSEQCLSAKACLSKESLFADLEELPGDVGRLVIIFTNGSFGKPLADYLAKLRGE